MCQRFHFSSHKLVIKPGVTPHVNGTFGNTKPNGLWYSMGNSWKDWCRGEAFKLEDFQYCTRLFINPNKMLHLRSVKDIDLFTERYGVDPYISEDGSFTSTSRINWDAVAQKYGGIEIPTYIYKRRMDGGATWYYGWDCASGCVWDTGILMIMSSMLQCTTVDGLSHYDK